MLGVKFCLRIVGEPNTLMDFAGHEGLGPIRRNRVTYGEGVKFPCTFTKFGAV